MGQSSGYGPEDICLPLCTFADKVLWENAPVSCHQCDKDENSSVKREPHLRNYLYQIDLWGCLWWFSPLMAGEGGSNHLWVMPLLGIRSWLIEKANWTSHGEQKSKQDSSMTSASASASRLLAWLLSKLLAEINPFFHQVSSGHEVYHSHRNTKTVVFHGLAVTP